MTGRKLTRPSLIRPILWPDSYIQLQKNSMERPALRIFLLGYWAFGVPLIGLPLGLAGGISSPGLTLGGLFGYGLFPFVIMAFLALFLAPFYSSPHQASAEKGKHFGDTPPNPDNF